MAGTSLAKGRRPEVLFYLYVMSPRDIVAVTIADHLLCLGRRPSDIDDSDPHYARALR